jgi:hypothetical protein
LNLRGVAYKFPGAGNDAASVSIPSGQQALIKAVTDAAAKPVVVVTMTGVPLDITELLANPKVGAILHAGVPGVQVRNALLFFFSL